RLVFRQGVPAPETSGGEQSPGGHPGGDSQPGRQGDAGDDPRRRLDPIRVQARSSGTTGDFGHRA
ncbi:MAG: hypothetical protein ABR615_09005, partial [Pseudonocardiaceae bacterium]